jgi:hypothetical protein
MKLWMKQLINILEATSTPKKNDNSLQKQTISTEVSFQSQTNTLDPTEKANP